jgi:DNA replication protein DnaD
MDLNQFFRWEQASRDTIDVKKIYVDMADDLVAGILLSQIVYWFLPDKEGKTKLRVCKDGELWLVKGREDWWDECRIKPRQFDTAFNKLMEKGLVEKKTYKFNGNPTTHIRIIWDNFLATLHIELDKFNTFENTGFHESVKTNLQEVSVDNTGFYESVKTTSQNRDSVLSKSVKTLTENTTENNTSSSNLLAERKLEYESNSKSIIHTSLENISNLDTLECGERWFDVWSKIKEKYPSSRERLLEAIKWVFGATGNAIQAERLNDFISIARMDENLIIRAIEITKERDKPISYLFGLLNNFTRYGIKTLADFKRHMEDWRERDVPT